MTENKNWRYVTHATDNQNRGYVEIIFDGEEGFDDLPTDPTVIAFGSIAKMAGDDEHYAVFTPLLERGRLVGEWIMLGAESSSGNDGGNDGGNGGTTPPFNFDDGK